MREQAMTGMSAIIATMDEQMVTKAKTLFGKVRQFSTTTQLEQVVKVAKLGQKNFDTEPDARPDIILLDLAIPEFSAPNGREAIEKLRETTAEVRIVALVSTGEEARRAVNAGVQDYVVKPIRLDDLRTRIQMLLEQQHTVTQPMDAPLPHLIERLHDKKTGHLDAKRISEFFDLTLSELARIIRRGISAVHKSPAALSLQEPLRPFEAIASGLMRLTGSEKRARMWLHASNPALEGHAPIEWLRNGRVSALAGFIQDLLEGRPA
ncbi:MAG TPA: response regulator [Nitrososphaera sp.]|nr:response regulator [Nitrososphaera sp.]